MTTKTLLHIDFLSEVSILITEEDTLGYSLHIKEGNLIERKFFKFSDGNEKELLAAFLIVTERYYLMQASRKRMVKADELRWDESYIQLAQFIEQLSPGFVFRWGGIELMSSIEHANYQESVFTSQQINFNQLVGKKEAFVVNNLFDENKNEIYQSVKWIIPKEELIKHNHELLKVIESVIEHEYLQYRQKKIAGSPKIFEDFEDLME